MISGLQSLITKPKPGAMLDITHPLSLGLYGCWPFNEGAGSVAHDISYNKNHLTLNMAPNMQGSGWVPSISGGGIGFNGVGDVAETIRNIGISGASPRTIAVRMIAADKDDEYYGQLLCGWGVCSTVDACLIIYDTNAATISDEGIRAEAWQSTINGSPNTITRGKSQHAVVTYDGTTVHIYVNGVIDVFGDSAWTTADSTMRVGHGLACDSYGGNYKGVIDSLHLYDRALSAAEVMQLYHDPFCNFLRTSTYYVPTDGLSIPVAMYHYKQQRIS